MKWRNVREQKRVPKRNINYLLQYYNLINFFTTTTTTTTALLSILCVVEQRLLLCEHCKRTFFNVFFALCLYSGTWPRGVKSRNFVTSKREKKKKCCAHCYSFGVSKLKYKFCVVLPIRESSPVIILPEFFSSRDQIISSLHNSSQNHTMPNQHYFLSGILYTQFIRRNSSSDYFFLLPNMIERI